MTGSWHRCRKPWGVWKICLKFQKLIKIKYRRKILYVGSCYALTVYSPWLQLYCIKWYWQAYSYWPIRIATSQTFQNDLKSYSVEKNQDFEVESVTEPCNYYTHTHTHIEWACLLVCVCPLEFSIPPVSAVAHSVILYNPILLKSPPPSPLYPQGQQFHFISFSSLIMSSVMLSLIPSCAGVVI